MNLNKVMLIGRTGKDPEINYIKEDVPVARFSLATNESYKTKEGEWRDITEWHNIIAWRNTAKYCENNLSKGMLIFIEGKLQTRSWQAQDGNTKYTTEIVADTIKILEKKSDGVAPLPSEEFPDNSQKTSVQDRKTPQTNESFLNEDANINNSNESDDLPF